MDITPMPTNQSWKLRSKHGRDHLFKTPESLWDAACLYFEWCDQNPIYKEDIRGPHATEVTIRKMRAYTLKGLCTHLGCGYNYFTQFEKQIAYKSDPVSEGFKTVLSLIRDAIYDQKFTGAAAGAFTASVISYDLGLMHKKVAEEDDSANKSGSAVKWGDLIIPI